MKLRRGAAIGVAAAVLVAGVWWAVGSSSPDQSFASDVARASETGRAKQHPAVAMLAAAANGATNAQPRKTDPLLTQNLLHRIEDLLLEAGPVSTPQELKSRAAALVQRHFDAQDAARAAALIDRYIDYRVSLGNLQPPKAGDAAELQSAINRRRALAERHFTPEEYAALFSQQEELDRFTVRQLEIARDTTLSDAARAAALRDAQSQLSAQSRALRADMVAQQGVETQTAAFDAAGTDDQTRYAARSKAYGDAAAQRLAQLDTEERDWQARLSRYSAERSAGAKEEKLAELKKQLFSSEEQLRVEPALALKASGK